MGGEASERTGGVWAVSGRAGRVVLAAVRPCFFLSLEPLPLCVYFPSVYCSSLLFLHC